MACDEVGFGLPAASRFELSQTGLGSLQGGAELVFAIAGLQIGPRASADRTKREKYQGSFCWATFAKCARVGDGKWMLSQRMGPVDRCCFKSRLASFPGVDKALQ